MIAAPRRCPSAVRAADAAGWRVRAFVAADAPALAELLHAAVHAVDPCHYSAGQLAAWSPNPVPAQRFIERAGTHQILVAVDASDRPVGFATLEPDGHLDHLYRHPDYAARGVGAALCAAIEAEARRRGIAALFTEASEIARPLFQRLGWRLDTRRDFVLDGVPIHNWRMTKCLVGGALD